MKHSIFLEKKKNTFVLWKGREGMPIYFREIFRERREGLPIHFREIFRKYHSAILFIPHWSEPCHMVQGNLIFILSRQVPSYKIQNSVGKEKKTRIEDRILSVKPVRTVQRNSTNRTHKLKRFILRNWHTGLWGLSSPKFVGPDENSGRSWCFNINT